MQKFSDPALQFALACNTLQGESQRDVLTAIEAALMQMFPGSRFQLDSEMPAAVGWLSPAQYQGYLRLPPRPLGYRVELDAPLLASELVLLETLLKQFEHSMQLLAFQEELDRQARRDWLTGLPHRFQLFRQLDAYGRLLSSYHVGLLEVPDAVAASPAQQAFADHLVMQVAQALKLHTLHAYQFDPGRFVFILDQQQKETLILHLQEWPDLDFRLAWADTREGPAEDIVDKLVSRMETV